MRFRWMRQTSRTACVTATVTRSLLKKIDVEIALDMSLPKYAVNPEKLSKLERKRVLKEATESLKRIEETRRSGSSSSG
ncbi:hypothetical protein PAEVO_28790 [Paenibacillus sp. GM2FR]|uniref:hypothetical protein n=1 Tax=Paenibacillus sp. GM2FR TaxID=2059268 RepID=UPI000C275672|nr:hypothetical protein [Paenibacillus sp. GM2FR]PJN56156.1 hypothetical protein PAEVO_28790 [Paenibacillus sp. GM2FR]